MTDGNVMLAASCKAPIDADEFAIAGGLHGAPVKLVRWRTVDLEVPADAEVVLDPTTWRRLRFQKPAEFLGVDLRVAHEMPKQAWLERSMVWDRQRLSRGISRVA